MRNFFGYGVALVLAVAFQLSLLAGAVFVIVKVLQGTGAI